MTKNVSLSEQIEQYEDDRALLDPILKEARQDRDEIKKLRAALTEISKHYANQDMNHVDFRVMAKNLADAALVTE
jgi:hypothetical protein